MEQNSVTQVIATIGLVGSKYRAKLLLPECLEPVEFFYQHEKQLYVLGKLNDTYGGKVSLLTQQQFQMELDHIKLFGERWNFDKFIGDVPNEDVIAQTINGMRLTEDRMSTDDIIEELDKANKTLDELENKTNAILPSPLVDEDPWLRN